MGKHVASITDYKRRKRRHYLDRIEQRLDRFILEFIDEHVTVDFMHVAEQYLAQQADQNAMAWDYQDLRDLVRTALNDSIGVELVAKLQQTSWYDDRWITHDEIIDRCFSAYILGASKAAVSR